MEYKFRIPNGRNFKMQFSPDANIAFVKAQICQKFNFDISKIKIIARATILHNDTVLKFLNLSPSEYLIVQPLSTFPTNFPKIEPLKTPEQQKPISPDEMDKLLKGLPAYLTRYSNEIKKVVEMGFPFRLSVCAVVESIGDVEKAINMIATNSVNETGVIYNEKFETVEFEKLKEFVIRQIMKEKEEKKMPESLAKMIKSAQIELEKSIKENPHMAHIEYRKLSDEKKAEVDELASQYKHFDFDVVMQVFEAADRQPSAAKMILDEL
ncbi:hypothetical protein TRFO_12541 [Tritrichomonas foetus]|uniref:Ubiquitin-like domain-containing protein n=1 Tax=Tritrichomonas foetus TaxID=1144522 RepID=A0A1J4L1C7_9EUKA|nr:hypothetical protein TRFO_12541 [Tritrichomonas foetus]|eukprot:OHT17218.1 hypothetical protein TRFO_12541 [Tritrichomonas foetus]